ncbi:ATP-grasp fold amidoligase family protein [Ectobacillus ponti]|uniref:Glycosyl transferase n=1 Tax=Ectobacillus ponti TaxID=2961894 RepID=A0AA42BR75_9BACI|nr:hypothetical protein [Ectobacillus ponti]
MKKRKRKKIKQTEASTITALKKKFKRIHGYDLDLKNPKSLNEKIQWIKLYGTADRFSVYVDKYLVRQFVEERIGGHYLIPLIGVFDDVNQIRMDSLPDSFVLKANHGSSWNILVKEKRNFNWEAKKKRVRSWLQTDFGKKTGEPNYNNIQPKIIIEEFIKDPTGDLKDYKIFCFHGEPKFIQVDGNRFTSHKRDLYDLNWDRIPVQWRYPNLKEPVSKPQRLNELLDIARQLSADFAFVRVDLYYTNEQIFFGELTFTPGSGLEAFSPGSYDEVFGQLLSLSRYV